MTDKLSALLHVWDSDYTEMGVYEAMTMEAPAAAEIRAKREQLKACIEQLRMAVAAPLPPDVKKRLEDWLENRTPREEPAKPKRKVKVFYIGPVRGLRPWAEGECLHPDEVIHIISENHVRGWDAANYPDAEVYVSGGIGWPHASRILAALRERGFTRTYTPSR
ncbi:hypothetical protein BJD78_gp09 [Arthrobacter phage KellEzio]|uniref:Uncharacterized protein n=1 Tax=Arthrobacter phage KellEzio TaxID=1796995 RepID=A0A140G694_9CAUD|nr:hypothetical protein BJD78_gp09 [Arthrobacter phage KellEzio]AMM44179.1 hypothetical protein KELLEZIO_9 [Arthrobacter phage KellEzio]